MKPPVIQPSKFPTGKIVIVSSTGIGLHRENKVVKQKNKRSGLT